MYIIQLILFNSIFFEFLSCYFDHLWRSFFASAWRIIYQRKILNPKWNASTLILLSKYSCRCKFYRNLNGFSWRRRDKTSGRAIENRRRPHPEESGSGGGGGAIASGSLVRRLLVLPVIKLLIRAFIPYADLGASVLNWAALINLTTRPSVQFQIIQRDRRTEGEGIVVTFLARRETGRWRFLTLMRETRRDPEGWNYLISMNTLNKF